MGLARHARDTFSGAIIGFTGILRGNPRQSFEFLISNFEFSLTQ
jgi:hypothetical protein